MPSLSENERLRAIGMLEAGSSQRDVARQFNITSTETQFGVYGNVGSRLLQSETILEVVGHA